MNETLKALYDSFYQPLDLTTEKQEIEACHWQLIEKLDKPERKLVLRIIDAKDRSAELQESWTGRSFCLSGCRGVKLSQWARHAATGCTRCPSSGRRSASRFRPPPRPQS